MTEDLQKIVLVTGSNGQLGRELQQLVPKYPHFRFLFTNKETLSITDFEGARNYFETHSIDVCINCAAYTEVDKAETDKETAYLINADAVGNLAALCKAHKAQFIHISTDYVFDGGSSSPYKEENSIAPINIYGASKLKGEELAFNANPSSIIIRTSWLYSSFGKNFVKTMLQLMEERPVINVVDDQFGSPTYAGDLADTILKMLSCGSYHTGIFHYSNLGVTSWYMFAEEIKKYVHSACVVRPIPTIQYPTPAPRPKFSVLDSSKIRDLLHLDIPEWQASLHECLLLIL